MPLATCNTSVEAARNKKTMYTCPVCGYDHMEYAPDFGELCPSCGTMFGVSDDIATHAELRHAWLMKGAQWWDRVIEKPEEWSVLAQLQNIEYEPTEEEMLFLSSQNDDTVEFVLDRPVINPKIRVYSGDTRKKSGATSMIISSTKTIDRIAVYAKSDYSLQMMYRMNNSAREFPMRGDKCLA